MRVILLAGGVQLRRGRRITLYVDDLIPRCAADGQLPDQ
jgi:hypothetical protein